MSNLATRTSDCAYCGVSIESFGTSVWYAASIEEATPASMCDSPVSPYGWHEPNPFCDECERPSVEGHYDTCSQYVRSFDTHTETVIYGQSEDTDYSRVVVARVVTDSQLPGRGTDHGLEVAKAIAEAVEGGWELADLSTDGGTTLVY